MGGIAKTGGRLCLPKEDEAASLHTKRGLNGVAWCILQTYLGSPHCAAEAFNESPTIYHFFPKLTNGGLLGLYSLVSVFDGGSKVSDFIPKLSLLLLMLVVYLTNSQEGVVIRNGSAV
ncbi:hypothetical protein DSO57_1013061 [Entomophthora muscae]|uniref:Uncharacterized protein n=1 Tax=Entomophthora muscae TaxID=34485 RepID=A0ACC2TTH5_9FUNG|nr:hypothetical protein DSO57_1013061 [Entomophthora muscae]